MVTDTGGGAAGGRDAGGASMRIALRKSAFSCALGHQGAGNGAGNGASNGGGNGGPVAGGVFDVDMKALLDSNLFRRATTRGPSCE